MTDLPVYRHKAIRCAYCGHRLDAISPPDGDAAPPGDGDATLCINCGEWLIIEGDKLRKPTDDELMDLGMDDRARRVRRAWVMTRGGRQ